MSDKLIIEIKGKSMGRAIQDDAFRQTLMADPKTAVKDAFELEIPEGKTLHVLEQAPGQHVLIIPQKPEGIPEGASINEIKELLAKDMPKLSERLSLRMEGYVNVLAKTWIDPEFKNQLLKTPEAVLRAENYMAMDENPVISVKVEDNENEYLVLPAIGSDSELTDEELELVSGGCLIVGILGFLAIEGVPIVAAVAGVALFLISW